MFESVNGRWYKVGDPDWKLRGEENPSDEDCLQIPSSAKAVMRRHNGYLEVLAWCGTCRRYTWYRDYKCISCSAQILAQCPTHGVCYHSLSGCVLCQR